MALLAPISWRVPPRHYGPWEQFASLLTEGLVARGVDVTLFATADSVTAAHLVGTAPRGYSEDPGLNPKVWECLHISEVFERAEEFDVIHNSFDYLPLTYSRLVDTPVITTARPRRPERNGRHVPGYVRRRRERHYCQLTHTPIATRSPGATTPWGFRCYTVVGLLCLNCDTHCNTLR